jgi:hypothetical protein
MTNLKSEVSKTLNFLIEMDKKIYGHVSKGIIEAIATQGYILTKKQKLQEVK